MTIVQRQSLRGLTCTNEYTRAFGWGLRGPYPLSSSARQLAKFPDQPPLLPRQGYRSARYRDIANNRYFILPPPIFPLSEYVDYNKDVILFGHAPEPIEEDKTWRLIAGNTNGIKPYGGFANLISVMERLKLLQT
jgi:hypothetical protein